MQREQLVKELNKILTLEHGHLGMYRNFSDHKDKEVRRTFRRFAELEMVHIKNIKNAILYLGEKPSMLADGGDIIGKMFGITIDKTKIISIIKSYSFIEKKSREGYNKFISKIEQGSDVEKFIAETAFPNMLEAELMHLWLKNKLQESQQ